MNIFVLDRDPYVAAEMHCDKHLVKMILEYAQLLSTAHRMLDGTYESISYEVPQYESVDFGTHMSDVLTGHSKTKVKKFWKLRDETATIVKREEFNVVLREPMIKFRLQLTPERCYLDSHHKHPAAIWARETNANYLWLFNLYDACLCEYTYRYGKQHAASRIRQFLSVPPKNIPLGQLTAIPQSMPIEFKDPDVVAAYHNYYVGAKLRFARWTNRAVPNWFANRLPEGLDVSYFTRTR